MSRKVLTQNSKRFSSRRALKRHFEYSKGKLNITLSDSNNDLLKEQNFLATEVFAPSDYFHESC